MNDNKPKFSGLEDRLITFSSTIIDLAASLPDTIAAKYLGGQILRSGTAPALNYGEAQAAESRADFIHKMKICLKELRETNVALRIVQRQSWCAAASFDPILSENNELISIFVASLKTASSRVN